MPQNETIQLLDSFVPNQDRAQAGSSCAYAGMASARLMAGGSGGQNPRQNLDSMAKTNPIKDTVAIEIAGAICKPTELWTAKHHALLLWKYFRKQGYLKGASPEEIAKHGREWDSFYSNARCGYASNQAKGMADAGLCATPQSAEAVAAEYD